MRMPERSPLWTWPWWEGGQAQQATGGTEGLVSSPHAPRVHTPVSSPHTHHVHTPGPSRPHAPRVHAPGPRLPTPMLTKCTAWTPVSQSPHSPCAQRPSPPPPPAAHRPCAASRTSSHCRSPTGRPPSPSCTGGRGTEVRGRLDRRAGAGAPEPRAWGHAGQIHPRPRPQWAFPGKQAQGDLASGGGRSPSPYVRPRRAGQEGRGCSPVCGVTQVRRRLGRRAGAARAPGDVDEDEPLDAGQLHLPLLHLQPEGPVQAAGVADLLQPDPHVHALVVEPGGDSTA